MLDKIHANMNFVSHLISLMVLHLFASVLRIKHRNGKQALNTGLLSPLSFFRAPYVARRIIFCIEVRQLHNIPLATSIIGFMAWLDALKYHKSSSRFPLFIVLIPQAVGMIWVELGIEANGSS